MKILIWGCGNMARAFTLGLKQFHPEIDFLCWNPSPDKAHHLAQALKGKVWQKGDQFDAVVLGFKPQKLTEAAEQLKSLLAAETQIISLLAATPLARLESLFGKRPIIRTMPNLLVEQGRGVVLWGQQNLTLEMQKIWQTRLNKLGMAPYLTEELVDLYTLHSGCAPAYLYRFIAEAGQFAAAHGGDAQLAQELLVATFRGTLASISGGENMEEKVSAVASKGGVTEAVLNGWKNYCPDYMQKGLAQGLAKLAQFKGA